MRDYTEEELKILSDMLPNIALQLRTSLATVYTAVDRLVPADMREKDAKTDRTAAAFYQSYYRLYRVISNLTDAGQLFDRKRFELYDDDIVGVCRSVCGEVDFLFNIQGVTLDFLPDRDSRIIGLAKTKQNAPTSKPNTPLSKSSWPELASASFCSRAPKNWLTTTAPPVASAANSTMMRLLIISTRLTPEMAASPQRDTIMVSAIPTVTSSNCSTSSGPVSSSSSFCVNSGFRPPKSGFFVPLTA